MSDNTSHQYTQINREIFGNSGNHKCIHFIIEIFDIVEENEMMKTVRKLEENTLTMIFQKQ